MRVGQARELALDRLDHGSISVAQARHRRAAGGVEVALPVAVDEIRPLAAHRDRIALSRIAVKDVAHGGEYTRQRT